MLSHAIHNSKPVVRSVPGAELFTFTDAVDEALTLRHDLKMILERDDPHKEVTEISYLFSIIIRLPTTTERHLMVQLQTGREAFHRLDIAEIGWITMDMNITDYLTRILLCEAMNSFLKSHRMEYHTLQWVLRGRTSRIGDLSPRYLQGPSPPPSYLHRDERYSPSTPEVTPPPTSDVKKKAECEKQ